MKNKFFAVFALILLLLVTPAMAGSGFFGFFQDIFTGRNAAGDAVIRLDRSLIPDSASVSWTRWYDRDGPSGSGDYETLRDLINDGNDICENPVDIHCVTVVGESDHSKTGLIYTCAPSVGGVCANDRQAPGDYCQDFKVRFACPIKETNEATCSDRIQNQGEAGVDCGGPCALACRVASVCRVSGDSVVINGRNLSDYCVDDVLIDYSCSSGSSMATNRVPCKYGCGDIDNDGIDACLLEPAPTCSDGLRNQGETGVDCGGPCALCRIVSCGDGKVNQASEKCDAGRTNGVVCRPDFGSSCTWCDRDCQIRSESRDYCGDGACNHGETYASCSSDCARPVCGDGVVNQAGEGCDAGLRNGLICRPDFGSSCSWCDDECNVRRASRDYCGDGACNYGETYASCSSDCARPVCGDGVVNRAGEECDDGSGNGLICRSGIGESCTWCDDDCQIQRVIRNHCGDGACNYGETTSSCPADCYVAPRSVCGDGVVNQAGEGCDAGLRNGLICRPDFGSSCSWCDDECNVRRASRDYCGDGACNHGETYASCSSDCTRAVCGDGACSSGETSSSCPTDCRIEPRDVCRVSDTHTIVYNRQTFRDSCLGGVLTDYGCTNDAQMYTQRYTCDYGCNTTVPVCNDESPRLDCEQLTGMSDCLADASCYWDYNLRVSCQEYDSADLPACTESDAGRDIFNPSITYGFPAMSEVDSQPSRERSAGRDSCSNGNLLEYYCVNGAYRDSYRTTCTYGCDETNRACAQSPRAENCNFPTRDTDRDGCPAGTDSDCGGIENVRSSIASRNPCADGLDNDCDGMIDTADDDGSCALAYPGFTVRPLKSAYAPNEEVVINIVPQAEIASDSEFVTYFAAGPRFTEIVDDATFRVSRSTNYYTRLPNDMSNYCGERVRFYIADVPPRSSSYMVHSQNSDHASFMVECVPDISDCSALSQSECNENRFCSWQGNLRRCYSINERDCVDRDGDNPHIASNVYAYNQGTSTVTGDFCSHREGFTTKSCGPDNANCGVSEAVCNGDEIARVRHLCANGCADGACLPDTPVPCETLDDEILNTIRYFGEEFEDHCDGEMLVHYTCDAANAMTETNIDCEFGCQDELAVCLPNPSVDVTCSDSDGGINFDDFGVLDVGVNIFTYDDSCNADGVTVHELYCRDEPLSLEDVRDDSVSGLTYMTAGGGAFVGISRMHYSVNIEVVDVDDTSADIMFGSELVTLGIGEYYVAPNFIYLLEDTETGSTPRVNYAITSRYIGRTTGRCQYRCQNGACLPDSTSNYPGMEIEFDKEVYAPTDVIELTLTPLHEFTPPLDTWFFLTDVHRERLFVQKHTFYDAFWPGYIINLSIFNKDDICGTLSFAIWDVNPLNETAEVTGSNGHLVYVNCSQQSTCCEALTAQCFACQAGVSVEKYCASNPGTAGCPSCYDGLMNGNELGIDCGGSCVACSGPTCYDGLRNQGETGVDCGGPCADCTQPNEGFCVDTDGHSEFTLGRIYFDNNAPIEVQTAKEYHPNNDDDFGVWVLSNNQVRLTLMGDEVTTRINQRVHLGYFDLRVTGIDYYGVGHSQNSITIEIPAIYDFCQSDTEVLELICDDDGMDYDTDEITCEYGCEKGVCRLTPNSCNGCFTGETCIPYGTRIRDGYCDLSGNMIPQKSQEEACLNNFECDSNFCLDDTCVSKGFLERLLAWLLRRG